MGLPTSSSPSHYFISGYASRTMDVQAQTRSSIQRCWQGERFSGFVNGFSQPSAEADPSHSRGATRAVVMHQNKSELLALTFLSPHSISAIVIRFTFSPPFAPVLPTQSLCRQPVIQLHANRRLLRAASRYANLETRKVVARLDLLHHLKNHTDTRRKKIRSLKRGLDAQRGKALKGRSISIAVCEERRSDRAGLELEPKRQPTTTASRNLRKNCKYNSRTADKTATEKFADETT
jgi:hypothetical protein